MDSDKFVEYNCEECGYCCGDSSCGDNRVNNICERCIVDSTAGDQFIHQLLIVDNPYRYERKETEQIITSRIAKLLSRAIRLFICSQCKTHCESEEIITNICSTCKAEPVLSRQSRFKCLEILKVICMHNLEEAKYWIDLDKWSNSGQHGQHANHKARLLYQQKQIERINAVDIEHTEAEKLMIDNAIKRIIETELMDLTDFAESRYDPPDTIWDDELDHTTGSMLPVPKSYIKYINKTLQFDDLFRDW